MPGWAEDKPRDFWDAADLYERENGRLYVSADFALPRGLDEDEQEELVRSFARELTSLERLPYSVAIHSGRDANGGEHNPHAHLMVSERRKDGIERSKEQWFRRSNSKHPERGGAPKSRTFHGREWVEHARERWAALSNEALERAGRPERVDHRSYDRQGIEREPGEHYGPGAAHRVARGDDHDRLEIAAAREEEERRLNEIEQELDFLANSEAVDEGGRGGGRGAVTHDDDEEREHRDRSDRHRSSGDFPER